MWIPLLSLLMSQVEGKVMDQKELHLRTLTPVYHANPGQQVGPPSGKGKSQEGKQTRSQRQ
jgi:hypothetical protein